MLLIDLIIGPFLSAIVLWFIGKKREYDFLFRNMLLVTFISSLATMIPVIGSIAGFVAFFGLFHLLEDMSLIETFWVALVAFLIKLGIVFILIMTISSLGFN